MAQKVKTPPEGELAPEPAAPAAAGVDTENPLELPRRAVLASVQLPDCDELSFRESLSELGRLAKTLGLTVEGGITQLRQSFDSGA